LTDAHRATSVAAEEFLGAESKSQEDLTVVFEETNMLVQREMESWRARLRVYNAFNGSVWTPPQCGGVAAGGRGMLLKLHLA
jgi:hypothetical protein